MGGRSMRWREEKKIKERREGGVKGSVKPREREERKGEWME